MKKLISLIAVMLVITAAVFAQAPQKMSYQAIIRNGSNILVTNTVVGMRISILQTSPAGTVVYQETQTPTTDANGLVSLIIGDGSPVSGSISSIDWASGPYYIKSETDPAGGTSYTITGTSQLLSVPYALFAGNNPGALTKFSSAWLPPSDPPSRDSSIDGTLTKVYYVAAPELTATVIATGSVTVYFRVGPIGPYILPYISNAGGRANAIQAILLPGKICITRPTFNETTPNNINLPATLEFRYTIIQ